MFHFSISYTLHVRGKKDLTSNAIWTLIFASVNLIQGYSDVTNFWHNQLCPSTVSYNQPRQIYNI